MRGRGCGRLSHEQSAASRPRGRHPCAVRLGREGGASRSVSRILSPPAGGGRPSILDAGCPAPRAVYPGPGTSSPWTPRRPPLFDLAPGGVYLAGRSPDRRWALPPPFHRCRGHDDRGCVISVALSFGSPRLGVTQRPALWSPDFPQAAYRPRPSDRLARRVYRGRTEHQSRRSGPSRRVTAAPPGRPGPRRPRRGFATKFKIEHPCA